jgi:glyoxylase-like metal-dependent hydrolase (beta-lactamase superfamily II)
MNDIPSWLQIITVPMPATLGSVNCLLVQGPKGVALIDTGLNDVSAEGVLVSALERNGLIPGDVETVLCTHHHVDHAGLGRRFQASGAEVWMLREDADILVEFYDHPERDEENASFFGRHELPAHIKSHLQKVFPFFRSLGERFIPSVIPEDAEELDLGGIVFDVLRLPGHTPGHIGLYQRDARLAITGDAVLSKKAFHISSRAGKADSGDHFEAYIKSLDKLISLGAEMAVPGHGSTIPDLGLAAGELKSHLYAGLDSLWNALSDTPRSAFALTGEPEQGRARPLPKWLLTSQTIACLNHLVRHGRARRVDTEAGVRYRSA